MRYPILTFVLLLFAACAKPPPITWFEPTREPALEMEVTSGAYRYERFPSKIAVVFPDTLLHQWEQHGSKRIATGPTIRSALISAVESAYEYVDVMHEKPAAGYRWILEFTLRESAHEYAGLQDVVITPSMHGGANTHTYEGGILIYRQTVTMQISSADGAKRGSIEIVGVAFAGGHHKTVEPGDFAATIVRCFQQISDRIGGILVAGHPGK
jgi:hypothetical protein